MGPEVIHSGTFQNTKIGEMEQEKGYTDRATTIVDPGIVFAGAEAEDTVLGGWDQILGRCKGVSRRPKLDGKVGSWLRAEDSKPRRAVGRAAGGGEERRVCGARDVDQRRACVDDARGTRAECRRAVCETGD